MVCASGASGMCVCMNMHGGGGGGGGGGNLIELRHGGGGGGGGVDRIKAWGGGGNLIELRHTPVLVSSVFFPLRTPSFRISSLLSLSPAG